MRLHRSQFTTKTKIRGTMKKLARPGTMRLGTVTERGREGEAQADMLYVGVDAHKAYSQMWMMDETGKVLERRRVASSREGMLEALGLHRGEPM